jgi:hypothetical protein
MEDQIIQWTNGPTPLWATSTLRHPGSAAAHQFQAAQGAEGLSHVQAETQGEHGWITSVPMSPWSPISLGKSLGQFLTQNADMI